MSLFRVQRRSGALGKVEPSCYHDGFVRAQEGNIPKIVGRREVFSSPWVTLVEKDVDWGAPTGRERFYSLAQRDYVTVFARTASGLIPVVRQYRPAIEAYTLELPAGLVEPGESPDQTARRELQEETGLTALATRYLGAFNPDTGRLSNLIHLVAIDVADPIGNIGNEEKAGELEVSFLTLDEIKEKIRAGAFTSMLQIGVLTVLELTEERAR